MVIKMSNWTSLRLITFVNLDDQGIIKGHNMNVITTLCKRFVYLPQLCSWMFMHVCPHQVQSSGFRLKKISTQLQFNIRKEVSTKNNLWHYVNKYYWTLLLSQPLSQILYVTAVTVNIALIRLSDKTIQDMLTCIIFANINKNIKRKIQNLGVKC